MKMLNEELEEQEVICSANVSVVRFSTLGAKVFNMKDRDDGERSPELSLYTRVQYIYHLPQDNDVNRTPPVTIYTHLQ